MNNRPTEELDKLLSETQPNRIGEYISDNNKYLADNDKGFYYYYRNVLDEKHIMLKDVYTQTGISESYGSKIISMEKHTRNRDLIIRLCIAGHFSLEEVNRALKLYGFNPLYSKTPKDACVIVALNNHIYDIDRINGLLQENGLEELK
ncbi:MAG: hypothetical protein IJ757_08875 [Clostridiales bacterium]|nr:hypothetical protein [Clostridiales bacterium]